MPLLKFLFCRYCESDDVIILLVRCRQNREKEWTQDERDRYRMEMP